MPATFPVDKYQIFMHASRETTGDRAIATVLTVGDSNKKGRLLFIPDGKPLPNPPNQPDANGEIVLHFTLSQLQPVLQTLREEKPVSIRTGGFGDQQGAMVFTGQEPTGEEEDS